MSAISNCEHSYGSLSTVQSRVEEIHPVTRSTTEEVPSQAKPWFSQAGELNSMRLCLSWVCDWWLRCSPSPASQPLLISTEASTAEIPRTANASASFPVSKLGHLYSSNHFWCPLMTVQAMGVHWSRVCYSTSSLN